jgi:hypothetical protein
VKFVRGVLKLQSLVGKNINHFFLLMRKKLLLSNQMKRNCASDDEFKNNRYTFPDGGEIIISNLLFIMIRTREL